MIDKITNPAAAASAYANTSKTGDVSAFAKTGYESFGDLVKNAAVNSITTMRAGESASARAVAGEASLPEVVQAVTASEVTLQTVVAVRDRVISAYQEIMRMPV